MALLTTERGVGGNTTSATTVAIPAGTNFTAGALVVLTLAYDNSGAQGADPFVSIADNAGNTWVTRVNALNDPGAANAGVALRAFTSTITSLTTANTITVTFSVATVLKAWVFNEFTTDNSETRASFLASASATGSSATPTITTPSMNVGNYLLGVNGGEATTNTSADDDVINGNWFAVTPQGNQVGGIGAAGIQVNTQHKLITGAGTQTYNLIYNPAVDWSIGWLSITEVALAQGTSFDPFGTMGFFGM